MYIKQLISILRSPWVLMSIPAIVGGLWLVNNSWVITDNLDKPYALFAGPVFVGSILLGWLFVAFFKTIVAWCKGARQAFLAWRKRDGSTFWLVIYIFLIVSVLESGTYFNELLGSNSLFGTLGYAAAFVVDLIAVECMRAKLGATRMRDKVGQNLYLLGVVACAGLSAWANTYTSLSHYHVPDGTQLPTWMVMVVPWTGMAFPLLIILMSFAADYTADQTSTKLDPENYQIQEDKRFKLLEIQRDMLKKRVEVEYEIDTLSVRSKVAKGPRVFFAKKQQVIESVLKEITPQLDALVEQNQAMQEQVIALVKQAQQNQELHRQDRAIIQHQIESIQTQRDVDAKDMIDRIEQVTNSLFQRFDEVINDGPSEVIEREIITDEMEAASDTHLEENDEVDEEAQKVLIDYPIFLQRVSASTRSMTLQDIIDATGHTPQRVHKAARNKAFKRTRRAGHYRVDSVINWLKTVPLPKSTNKPITDEISPSLSDDNHVDNGQTNGHKKRDTRPLQNLVPLEV